MGRKWVWRSLAVTGAVAVIAGAGVVTADAALADTNAVATIYQLTNGSDTMSSRSSVEAAPWYSALGQPWQYQVWDFSDPAPAGFHRIYRRYDPSTGQHTVTKDANNSEFALGWLADTKEAAASLGPCTDGYFPPLDAAGQAAQTAVFDTAGDKYLGYTKEALGVGPCKVYNDK